MCMELIIIMKGGSWGRSICLTTYKRQIIDLKLTTSTGSFFFSTLPKTRRITSRHPTPHRPSSSTLCTISSGCRTTYVQLTDEQLTNDWGGRNWRGDNWQTTDERTDEGRELSNWRGENWRGQCIPNVVTHQLLWEKFEITLAISFHFFPPSPPSNHSAIAGGHCPSLVRCLFLLRHLAHQGSSTQVTLTFRTLLQALLRFA